MSGNEVFDRNKQKKATFEKVTFVVPLGLEPRLFCTKSRRVASYTMGQFHNVQNLNWCVMRAQM
jgi:hypothetical protein